MSTSALLLMVAIGGLAVAIGIGLLLTASRRRREAGRYVLRLAGVMFCAVGAILIVFVGSWTFAA